MTSRTVIPTLAPKDIIMPRFRSVTVSLLLLGVLMASTLPQAAATESAAATAFAGTLQKSSAWVTHSLELVGPARIDAVLDWKPSGADVNVGLQDPSGTWVVWASSTSARPEALTWDADVAGTWTLGVWLRSGKKASYTLGATVTPVPPVPTEEPSSQGTLDASSTWATHSVELEGPARIDAALDWSADSADLNLGLQDPSGTWVAWASSATARPELLSWDAEVAGTWTLGVSLRSGTEASYTVETVLTPGTPEVIAPISTTPLGWAVENESHPVKTYTEAEAVDHAERFPLITARRDSYGPHVPAMKQANPDLTLFAYMNGAFAQANQGDAFPSSWYLYDAQGNKITNNWNIYLMNPAHTGWVASRVEQCIQFLSVSSYDGCMLDNMGAGAIWPGSLSAQPINPATGSHWTNNEWLQATTQLTAAVKQDIAPRPVLANGLVSGQSYFNQGAPSSRLLEAADYGLAETFVRTAGQGIAQYRTEAAWKADVDMLLDASQRGGQVLTLTKVWVDATDAQMEKWYRYALATFLLGDDGTHHFAFGRGWGTDTMQALPHTSLPLGTPVGPYAKVDGVYQRSYTDGLTLVNPTSDPVTVPLPARYVDLDGLTTSGSLTLAPYSGTVLRTS